MAEERERQFDPEPYLKAVTAAMESQLMSERGMTRRGPLPYVYASQRRECVRQMALDLLHPEERGEFNADALVRMQQGVEREESLSARLIKAGPRCEPSFKVIEQQRRFEIKDRDGTVVIVGKVDGCLQFLDGERPWFEVKSGRTYEDCRSIEDLDRGRWTSHAVDQLLAYLLGSNQSWGFFIIVRMSGMPTLIPVVLEDHLDRAESFIQEARIAVDCSRGVRELPPFTERRSLCAVCDHKGKSCTPPDEFGEGITLITDPELVEAVETVVALEETAKRYDRARKSVSERLKAGRVVLAVAGQNEIVGRFSRSVSYRVPTDVRDQYREEKEDGRYIFTITPVTQG